MRNGLVWLALFSSLFLPVLLTAQISGQRARIYGESFVNLRSGPDLSHPVITVLREGDEVRVERREGSWYFVSLLDGTQGYVHRTLVRISDQPAKAEAPEPPPAVTIPETKLAKPITEPEPTPQVKERKKTVAPPVDDLKEEELPNPFSPNFAAELPKGSPLPVIKVLEGRELEVLGWLAAGLCIFVLGWIFGGNYYVRRDRVKRTKIRF